MMDRRRLGQQGLEVSAIGLGCMTMSGAYGASDSLEAEETLRRAVELGITFFDTANVYGQGHNEEFIGSVLAARRDELEIATKFGLVVGKFGHVDGRADIVEGCCDESLQRLGTDRIDLYYLHRVDPDVPIEETVGAMAELVAHGKVRTLGLSEVNSDTLRRAHAVHPITAVQSEYSLWTRDPEQGILATCRELGVGFVPFSPLGRGILTGELRDREQIGDGDFRGNMPRFQPENFPKNTALVARLEKLADERNCRPAQLALAWLLAQTDDIVPIPGTKRVRTLEENAAAASLSLSDSEVDQLGEVFGRDGAAGARYSGSHGDLSQKD